MQTHAQYNEESDEYEAHRVGQGFEMGQFIKHTSSNCDYVIVGGDFNFQPKDLGFKLIRDNGNLKDAWIDQVWCDCNSVFVDLVMIGLFNIV